MPVSAISLIRLTISRTIGLCDGHWMMNLPMDLRIKFRIIRLDCYFSMAFIPCVHQTKCNRNTLFSYVHSFLPSVSFVCISLNHYQNFVFVSSEIGQSRQVENCNGSVIHVALLNHISQNSASLKNVSLKMATMMWQRRSIDRNYHILSPGSKPTRQWLCFWVTIPCKYGFHFNLKPIAFLFLNNYIYPYFD